MKELAHVLVPFYVIYPLLLFTLQLNKEWDIISDKKVLKLSSYILMN